MELHMGAQTRAIVSLMAFSSKGIGKGTKQDPQANLLVLYISDELVSGLLDLDLNPQCGTDYTR